MIPYKPSSHFHTHSLRLIKRPRESRKTHSLGSSHEAALYIRCSTIELCIVAWYSSEVVIDVFGEDACLNDGHRDVDILSALVGHSQTCRVSADNHVVEVRVAADYSGKAALAGLL